MCEKTLPAELSQLQSGLLAETEGELRSALEFLHGVLNGEKKEGTEGEAGASAAFAGEASAAVASGQAEVLREDPRLRPGVVALHKQCQALLADCVAFKYEARQLQV